MTYSIIGTGAIGGYYGGRLANAGQEVHFLAHSDYDQMKEALIVDSCNGSFTIEHPKVYRDTKEMPKTDVIIVALKTINNHLLPQLLQPLLHPETIVLLIQNGLCVEQDLAEQIPGIQLAAGLGFICSTKTGPAHIQHQDYGALTIANYNCKDAQKVEQIAEDFRKAGVQTETLEYNYGRWRKAIWNLPFNGMTVVHDTDTGTLVNNPTTLAQARDIMHEVVAIANALGVETLGDANIEKNINDTMVMRPYSPSMKVDYDNHRKMEVYYLYTRAIKEADRLGVPCPNLKELEQALLKRQPW